MKKYLLLILICLLHACSSSDIEEKTYDKIYINSKEHYTELIDAPYSDTESKTPDTQISVRSIYEFRLSAQDLGLDIHDPNLELNITFD